MKRVIVIATILGTLVSCSEKTKSEGNASETTKDTLAAASEGMVIAYFENDSIPENFTFYKNTLSVLEEKRNAFESKMLKYQNEYQAQVNAFQRGYESQSLAPNQIEQLQRNIAAKEKSIVDFQQREGAKLQEEEFESNNLLINKLELYGKDYSAQKGFTLLLVKQKGGQVLFADPSMDVTMDFIDYMNEQEKLLDGENTEEN